MDSQDGKTTQEYGVIIAFENIKEEINSLPKIFFVDYTSPVTLRTDASDYGIAGYLYQTVNGKEIPIGFMSKSLTDTEKRWKVGDKETFAIIVSLDHFNYILHDQQPFTD